MSAACFFRDFPDVSPCEGKLRRGHLVPKALLRREGHSMSIWDDRAWEWMCGGHGYGNGGHHGQFDALRLRIPANMLPTGFREMMREIGMEWWIEKHLTGPGRS